MAMSRKSMLYIGVVSQSAAGHSHELPRLSMPKHPFLWVVLHMTANIIL